MFTITNCVYILTLFNPLFFLSAEDNTLQDRWCAKGILAIFLSSCLDVLFSEFEHGHALSCAFFLCFIFWLIFCSLVLV